MPDSLSGKQVKIKIYLLSRMAAGWMGLFLALCCLKLLSENHAPCISLGYAFIKSFKTSYFKPLISQIIFGFLKCSVLSPEVLNILELFQMLLSTESDKWPILVA